MEFLAQIQNLDSPVINSGVTLITVLMCLIQGVFAYLTNRDRLAFDLERNNLSHAVKDLEFRADECEKDRQQLQAALEKERADRHAQYRDITRQMKPTQPIEAV